jgi:hypothetical protein
MTPNTFEQREQAMENKYARDEEFRFKVDGHAVKLFGLWSAKQLGKGASYADELISDFGKKGIEAVIERVLKDFSAKGIETTEHHLRNQYGIHLEEAKRALSE